MALLYLSHIVCAIVVQESFDVSGMPRYVTLCWSGINACPIVMCCLFVIRDFKEGRKTQVWVFSVLMVILQVLAHSVYCLRALSISTLADRKRGWVTQNATSSANCARPT